MVNILAEFIHSVGSGRKIGGQWKTEIGFYDYNSGIFPLTEKRKKNIIKDHVENDIIKEVVIYKTPLEKWIPKSETVLFHAYLVYRACNKRNQTACNWWSVEKTSTSFEVQRSEYLCDVVTLIKNKPRLGNLGDSEEGVPLPAPPSFFQNLVPESILNAANATKKSYLWLINKQEPQVNRQDRCKKNASPKSVLKFIHEEDGYRYDSNNCKRFAMKIFNEIASCKKWSPFAP